MKTNMEKNLTCIRSIIANISDVWEGERERERWDKLQITNGVRHLGVSQASAIETNERANKVSSRYSTPAYIWQRVKPTFSLNDYVGSGMDRAPSAHVPKINAASDSDVLPRSSQLMASGAKQRHLQQMWRMWPGCDVILMNTQNEPKPNEKTTWTTEFSLNYSILYESSFECECSFKKQELETKRIFISADMQNYAEFVFISLWELKMVLL